MEPNQEYTQVQDLLMNWEEQRRGAHTALPMGFFGNVGRTDQLFVYVSFKLLFITYLYTPFDSELLNSELKILATCTTNSFFVNLFLCVATFLSPAHPQRPSTLSNLFQEGFLMQKLLTGHPDSIPRFFSKTNGASCEAKAIFGPPSKARIDGFC